jgi:hypothetical protein
MSENDKLGDLSRTILEHAKSVARQEWETEHRQLLEQVLSNAGLSSMGESRSVLEIGAKVIPVEAVVFAIRERFLKVRVHALVEKASAAVVEQAFRKVEGEEDGIQLKTPFGS